MLPAHIRISQACSEKYNEALTGQVEEVEAYHEEKPFQSYCKKSIQPQLVETHKTVEYLQPLQIWFSSVLGP